MGRIDPKKDWKKERRRYYLDEYGTPALMGLIGSAIGLLIAHAAGLL